MNTKTGGSSVAWFLGGGGGRCRTTLSAQWLAEKCGRIWPVDDARGFSLAPALALLLLASPAFGQEPSEEVKVNALKLGYILNDNSMTRHPGQGSIDVSGMTLDSPHIRDIPLDKPIFPKANDPEAAAVEGPPPATSTHRKKRRSDR